MVMVCPSTIARHATLAAASGSWPAGRRGRPPFACIRVGKLPNVAAERVKAYPDSSTIGDSRPDYASLTQETGTELRLSTTLGDLLVRPINIELLPRTAELLAETYFQTYNLMPYKRYIYQQIKKYLQHHMRLSQTMVLVAVLNPSPDYQNMTPIPSSSTLNLPDQDVLAGTAELSFSPTTRTPYPGLEPPADCAFLCNMAVVPAFRRKGIATSMLKAAVLAAGSRDLYLHVRCQDKGAIQLYERNGFTEEKVDNFLVAFLGRDRKKLMRRAATSK